MPLLLFAACVFSISTNSLRIASLPSFCIGILTIRLSSGRERLVNKGHLERQGAVKIIEKCTVPVKNSGLVVPRRYRIIDVLIRYAFGVVNPHTPGKRRPDTFRDTVCSPARIRRVYPFLRQDVCFLWTCFFVPISFSSFVFSLKYT